MPNPDETDLPVPRPPQPAPKCSAVSTDGHPCVLPRNHPSALAPGVNPQSYRHQTEDRRTFATDWPTR